MKKIILSIVIFVLGGIFYWYYNALPKKFVPYTSTQPMAETKTMLNGDQRIQIEKKIAELEKSKQKFDEKTEKDVFSGTLFSLYSYYELLGNNEKAKESLETVLLKYPTAELLNAYGSLIFSIGDKKAGINYVRQGIKQDPTNPNIWLNRIELEKDIHQGNNKVIEKIYDDALRATNYHLNIVISYASYMGRIGNKEAAIKAWNKAKIIYPPNSSLYQKEIDILNQ